MNLATWAQEAAQQRRQRERRTQNVLITPAVFWLIVFFLLPLSIVLVYSFMQDDPGGGVIPILNIENYVNLLNPDYFLIFWQSFNMAIANTLICLLISYPVAYFITRRPPRTRALLMMLVIVPFWTNFLVRTYAWKVVLGANGIISSSLMAVGLIERPLRLLYTQTAVMIGLVYSYLPFMLLPIYANLEKFDHTLMEAAHDSGADNFWAFVRVMLPLSRPGIIAGSVLTFIPSISAYILSTILGGGKFLMLGDLITREFTTYRDWPFASAISITLMVMVSIGVFIYFRLTTEAERL